MVDTASFVPAVVPVSPAPASPALASSLQGSAAADKALIETWVGNPTSPYWRGADGWSSGRIQAHYQDLLRGELQGGAGVVGPPHQVDADLPMSAEGYNIAGADGARSMSGEDRDIVDSFLPAAFSAGLGQRKVTQAVGWALTIPGITVAQFEGLAIAAGWSDRAMAVCIGWYRKQLAARGGGD